MNIREYLANVFVRAVTSTALIFATIALSASAASAAKKRVLLDPPPGPSAGSKAPRVPDGSPAWVETEFEEPAGLLPPLIRSDVPDDQEALAPFVTPAPTVQWDAITQPGAGSSRPPDDHVAAGPGAGAAGRVVEVTNTTVRIYNKLGAPVTGLIPLSTMFVPAPGSFVFDPKILFDQASGRFFIVVLEADFAGAVCASPLVSSRIRIAVSTTGAPNTTGAADWFFYAASGLIPIGGSATWADYPSIGADSNSLFVTTNQFSDGACAFLGANIRVYDKAALIAGAYAAVDATFNVAVTPGVGTIQPAHVYGATDNGGFYLINRAGPGLYRLYNVTGDPVLPAVSTALFPWVGGAFPPDTSADQCGVAGIDLDTLSGRLMNAVYRNGHLWTVQTAQADADGQTEVVWHQIKTNSFPAAAPAVAQSGFINGTGGAPWTYTPAINVNSAGDTLINFMQSSAGTCPTIFGAVRLNGDPVGTFQTQALVRASAGFYDSVGATAIERWGDYSGNAVDPTDQCFWISNEYAFSSVAAGSVWGTHIAKFCPSSEGACCFGPTVCGMRKSGDCATQGGTFRGVGSKCPTQIGRTAQHQSGTVVHWVGPAQDCNQIVPAVGTSNCCSEHAGPGCDEPQCNADVCLQLPHCCSDGWDASCVQAAQSLCGKLCNGISCQPGQSFDGWITSTAPAEPTCNMFGGSDAPPIPPGFFDPGSDPFIGTVCYHGQPLGPTPFGDFGPADTVVRRFGDPFDRCQAPGLPDITVPIQIVALDLRSVQPIIVTQAGGQNPQQWNVKITLSDFPQQTGTMTATKTHCNGGTWSSVLPVQAKFTFTRVQNPLDVRVFDTGPQGFPPVVLPSVTANLPWVHDIDPNLNLPTASCTNFHPGIQDPTPSTDCDCNFNFILDSCDIANGLSPDCNLNGKPDQCDPDDDLDLLPNGCDNCQATFNPGQENFDGDFHGDVCDACPFLGERLENDQDGDKITQIPNVDYPTGDNCACVANVAQTDADVDLVGDVCDNCPSVANPGQEDDDSDGLGNACDCAPNNPANPPPGEAFNLRYALPSPDKQTLGWTPDPVATAYDVVRGTISALPVGPGGGDELCSNDLGSASLVDGSTPPAGQGYFYLVRSVNGCGNGAWGNERHNLPPSFPPRNSTTCP